MPCLSLDTRQILQKNHRPGAAPRGDRHQPCAQVGPDLENIGRINTPGIPQPFLKTSVQRRQVILERNDAGPAQPFDHALGRGIGLAHDALAVDHDHAMLHVLDHQLIDLSHVGKVNFTLRRQLFADQRALGQGMRQPGKRKIADRQQAGLRILRTAFEKTQNFVSVLKQDGDGGDRREKQGQLPSGNQARRSEGGQQQQSEAAGQSAARIHQQHDKRDIATNLNGKLKIETLTGADQHKHGQAETCVSRGTDQIQTHVP